MVLVEAITTVVEVIFHRRRIYTEAKAKVVPSVWGAEFIQFLAALATVHQDDLSEENGLHQDDMKNR